MKSKEKPSLNCTFIKGKAKYRECIDLDSIEIINEKLIKITLPFIGTETRTVTEDTMLEIKKLQEYYTTNSSNSVATQTDLVSQRDQKLIDFVNTVRDDYNHDQKVIELHAKFMELMGEDM